MDIRPILSTLGRHRIAAALIVLGIAGVAGAVAGLRPARGERPDAEATGPDGTADDADGDAAGVADGDNQIGGAVSSS